MWCSLIPVIFSGGNMTDKIVLDHYKEMIEKTKQLHLELIELSSKMSCIVDRIDAELPDNVIADPLALVGSGDLFDVQSSKPEPSIPHLKNVLDNDHLYCFNYAICDRKRIYYLIGACGIIYSNMEMTNMDEKKRRRFFDEFFENDSFEDVADMIENIMDAIDANLDELSGMPKIYGFSITHRSGEDPVVRELGSGPNTGRDNLAEGSCMGISESEPLVDIIETDVDVHFMAELPCVEKEDIKLSAEEMTLHISASRGDWSYVRTFDLSIPVYPESAKATFNNGVLEVIFKRRLLDAAYNIDIE